MNVEKLQERIVQLHNEYEDQKKKLEQIIANMNMLNGMKVECQRWIDEDNNPPEIMEQVA